MNPKRGSAAAFWGALLLCTDLNLPRSVAAEADPARQAWSDGVRWQANRVTAETCDVAAEPRGPSPMQAARRPPRRWGRRSDDIAQNRTIGRALSGTSSAMSTGPTPSRPIIGEWAISTVGSGRGDPHENWRQPSRSIRTGSYSTADYAPAPAATVCSTSRVALRRIAGSATAAPVQHPHPTFGSCRGWNTADYSWLG